MNQPQTADAPDGMADPRPTLQGPRTIEPLDACGNGYTAEDLARALAASGSRH